MSFDNLNLIHTLQKALSDEGYVKPTPIQEQSIPHLLNRKDMIGIAQTGTGKTAAFILPIMNNMSSSYKVPKPGLPRVLVIAPTRELAAQIGESFTVYGKYTRFKHTVIFGGIGQGSQVKALSKGVDSLIATPGRLLDLIEQGHINLSSVEYFVLDEADRMLDMGFINDVYKVVGMLPKKRQSLFFSATMSPEISMLAKKLLSDPVHVAVTPQATTVELIDQFVFFVDQENKNDLLLQVLLGRHLECVLIFTRTKHRANKVTEMLNKNSISAGAIHGNKSQNHRTKTLQEFRSGNLRVLVATDIAARGIDIEDISHVINYDLPNIPESYVHRIGRTARAGAEGTAFSFCASDEREFLGDIEKLIRMDIDVAEHKYHSERARNATGDAARPAPKKQRVHKGQKKQPPHLKNKQIAGTKESNKKSSRHSSKNKNTSAVSGKNIDAGNSSKGGFSSKVKNRSNDTERNPSPDKKHEKRKTAARVVNRNRSHSR